MEKQSKMVTENEAQFVDYIRGVRERAKGVSTSGGSSGPTTSQVKEYSIKIDAEDVQALYNVVNMIEELSIESEWADNFKYAYDGIREQIKEDVIW